MRYQSLAARNPADSLCYTTEGGNLGCSAWMSRSGEGAELRGTGGRQRHAEGLVRPRHRGWKASFLRSGEQGEVHRVDEWQLGEILDQVEPALFEIPAYLGKGCGVFLRRLATKTQAQTALQRGG